MAVDSISDAQLETALRNADAAGDVQAAQTISREIVRRQKPGGGNRLSISTPGTPDLLKPPDLGTPPSRSTGDMLARGAKGAAGFIGGNFNRGIADIMGIPGDTVVHLAELGAIPIHALETAIDPNTPPFQPPDESKLPFTSAYFNKALEGVGAVNQDTDPDSGMGRVAAAAMRSVPAALTGKPPNVGALLRGMTRQAVGGAAGQTAAEAGGGPAGAAAAQIAGQHAPGLPRAVVRATHDALTRGTNVQANLADQRAAGIRNPSAAAAAESPTLAVTERTLGNAPGGGPVREAANTRAADVGKRLTDVARGLGPKVSAEAAGKQVQAGGEQLVREFRATQEQLYTKLDGLVDKKKTQVNLDRLRDYLRAQTKAVPGAEKTTAGLATGGLRKLWVDIESDLAAQPPPAMDLEVLSGRAPAPTRQASNAVSWEAADIVRRRIGDKLSNIGPGGADDIPKTELRHLYGLLTSAMEGSLAGQPKALDAWKRAKQYTTAGHDRIDNVIVPLLEKGAPEAALASVMGKSKAESSTFRRIMGSLTPAQADTVRGYIIEGMGKANPGAQDATGQRFSIDTFVTRWVDMPEESKKVLFRDPAVRADMETIARASSSLKEAGRQLYNPAGTAAAGAHVALIGEGAAAGAAALTGHPGWLAAIGAQIAGTNAAARAMNSKWFLKWLADGTKIGPDRTAEHMAALTAYADREKDEETRAAIYQVSGVLNGQSGGSR